MMNKDLEAPPATALAALHERFQRHLYLPDPTIIDFTVAVAVANRLGGDPVWAFLVAAPSSGKTEALQSMTGLDEVHPLSSLTANTFISGAKNSSDKPASLLLRLPDGALLILKDFGTILSMRDESRAEILGQLREIYDGSFAKEFGTGRTIRWEGRLGFLAGTTPAIDQHHAVISVLGERFLYFRIPESNRKAMGRRAVGTRDEVAMRRELQAAVTEYMAGLSIGERLELPEDVTERLVNIADICTWARTGVYRDRYTRDIEVAPTKEAPGRFIKQLASLYRALVVMGHQDPLGLVCRVALDSTPPARAAVLRTLAANGATSSTDLRKVSRLSSSANTRLLGDLEALDLIEIAVRAEPNSGTAHIWDLTSEGRRTWHEAFGGDPLPQTSVGGGKREEIELDAVGPEVAGEARQGRSSHSYLSLIQAEEF